MAFPSAFSLETWHTGRGPRAPSSWLPCLPEGAGVHPGTLDRDRMIPLFLPWNREQRASPSNSLLLSPPGLGRSQMQQELAQYLPQTPKQCCLLQSWCSGCRESQRDGWAGKGGMSGSSLDAEGKALGSRASVSGAALVVHLALCWQQALCHRPQAGGRKRNYCKWERQVCLVSRRSRLGKHVSEDDRRGPGISAFPRPPPLPSAPAWHPELPAFPLGT